MVPGERMCSFDLPTACTGRNSADKSSGSLAIDRVDHALADDGVGRDREMRPMLFDRRDRQHRDRLLGIEAGEVFRGELQPMDLAHGQNLTIAARTLAMNALRCSSVATFM